MELLKYLLFGPREEASHVHPFHGTFTSSLTLSTFPIPLLSMTFHTCQVHKRNTAYAFVGRMALKPEETHFIPPQIKFILNSVVKTYAFAAKLLIR